MRWGRGPGPRTGPLLRRGVRLEGYGADADGPAAAIPFLMAASEDAISRCATITAARTLEEALAAARQIQDPGARAGT